MSEPESQYDLAVLGCGNMGSAIARAALAAGHRVVVWNRTRSRARALQHGGATVAASAAEAIATASIAIICVSATADVQDLLQSAESAVAGRTVLNLTSGTPDDATDLGAWAADHAMSFLDGAILAYPEQIGSAEARIVVAGAEDLWRAHRELLRDLAGASSYAGGDPSAANVLDVGITGVFYFSSVVAFIEAVRYLEAAGVSGEPVTDLIGYVTSQLDWQLRQIVQRGSTGDFSTDQATLAVYYESGRAFLDAVLTQAGAPLLRTTVGLLGEGVAAGLGDRDISVLVTAG